VAVRKRRKAAEKNPSGLELYCKPLSLPALNWVLIASWIKALKKCQTINNRHTVGNLKLGICNWELSEVDFYEEGPSRLLFIAV
jgi:hypothetical protein